MSKVRSSAAPATGLESAHGPSRSGARSVASVLVGYWVK